MAKTYTLQFGSGDPRVFTGLNATFLIFANASSGATVTPPSITELFAGTGIYKFTWGTTTPIAFLADAATTSPGTAGRYVSGSLDPADRADEYGTTMIALGTTLIGYGVTGLAIGTTGLGFGQSAVASGITAVGLGNTAVATALLILAQGSSGNAIGTSILSLIGTTGDSFGSTSVDPTTLFGFLKRSQEFWEGNQTYTKATGLLDFYSRGSSTLLVEKTIADTASSTTKT